MRANQSRHRMIGTDINFGFGYQSMPLIGALRRSANRYMHYYIASIVLLAVPLLGYSQQEQVFTQARSAAASVATSRTGMPADVVTNHLVTTFGQHSVGGVWTVQVSQGTVNDGPEGVSSKPWPWSAHPGWFVLTENDKRVWAYDGERNLWLFERTATATGSVMSLNGPNKFPDPPVPEAVLTRLSSAARKSIQQSEQCPSKSPPQPRPNKATHRMSGDNIYLKIGHCGTGGLDRSTYL